MKRTIIPTLLAVIILAACGSGKKFQATNSQDKPLFAAINELNKHPDNAKAQNDLKLLYKQALERHEEAADVYRNNTDDKKWDKVLTELNALQHIYNSLQATAGSFYIVKPKSYLRDIESLRNEAAEDFYVRGNSLLLQEGRENSLHAYEHFKKANSYVIGYKNVDHLIKESYEKSIVNVVINPIEDNNVYFSGMSSWGMSDFRYRPEDYQQSLVRDLGGSSANIIPARFYTERELRRERIDADWEVDISWRAIDPVRTMPQQYNRQVSRSVEMGKDTTGKPVYQTVYATLLITQQTYTVRGDLDYRINDLLERTSIDQGLVHDEVSWTESTASYSGDSRALSQDDWMMVNNRNYNNNPTRGDVLNSLMRKMYPELRRRIQQGLYNN